MARATLSRVEQLGRAAVAALSALGQVVDPGACLLVGGGVLVAPGLGHVVEHEALALGVAQDAALAAHGLGHEDALDAGGQTMPVGWNCTNSMSMSSAPAR